MARPLPDHPDTIAARANADLRARGVDDLRFDAPPVFRSTRAGQAVETPPAPSAKPERPMATPKATSAPSPAMALRARTVEMLRLPQATGRAGAAIALATATTCAPDTAARLLADLPQGASLDLPNASLAPEAAAEATRINAIMTAGAEPGRHHQAVALVEAGIDASAAVEILAAMRPAQRIASIEERAAQEAEFGGDATDMADLGSGASVRTGWERAVKQANERIGATAAAAPTTLTTTNPTNLMKGMKP